ncbi:MAG: hypothetical protein RLZZ546_169, partial [Bacteroidota bacterium]
VKKISNIQKKNDMLKDKINDLYLEANNKGLVNVRSTLALSSKMNNARTSTLEKILEQGKKLIKDNKNLTWASIQKLDKKTVVNNNDKYEPIIKNTQGNIFKNVKDSDKYEPIIKNTKGNIFAQKPKKIKFKFQEEKDISAMRVPKDIRFKLKEHSILKAVQTFNFEPTQRQSKDYRVFLQSLIKPLINQNKGMKRKDGNFKFFIKLVGRFYQPKDGKEDDRTLYSNMQTYTNDTQLKANIMLLIDELILKIEEIQDMTNGSGWLWVSGKSVEVQFNKYRPIGGSSYIELPEKIAKKKSLC